ncbi:MAG: glycine cleavage T C-terminal barrel domain-containing protein [Chthoniobacteraceae bacterium]
MSSDALRAAYRDFQQRGGVIDLSSRLKLALTGADRVRYLNGQVTANVLTLKPGDTRPACVTTPKGRLCAEVVISATADALFIDADASLRETLPARLERYIIADDATLTELPAETRLLHFLGAIDELPCQRANRFGRDGWDYWTDAATLETRWPAISAERAVVDEALLETLRIEAGIPRWGRDIGEDTLPPEAGLDRTHIDYHKGCYVGQEVISRLRSVGHVNRELTGFTADAPIPCGPVSAAGADQPCGAITSTAWSFALERPIALGYLRRAAPRSDLFTAGTDPIRITACDLPFTK